MQSAQEYNTINDFLPRIPEGTWEEAFPNAIEQISKDPIDPETLNNTISELQTIMNLSPEDGRYRKEVEELSPYLSEAAYFRARVIIEVLWFRHLITNKVVPEDIGKGLEENLIPKMLEFADNMPLDFVLRAKEIEKERNHDIIAMIEALRERFSDLLTPETEGYIHLGLTSEDINDLSQKFMFINAIRKVLNPAFFALTDTLRETSKRMENIEDPKFPGHSLGARYKKYLKKLEKLSPKFISPNYMTVKLGGGATGNHSATNLIVPKGMTGQELGESFIEDVTPGLELEYLPVTAQINPHDDLAIWADSADDFAYEIEKLCTEIWEDSGTDVWVDVWVDEYTCKRLLYIEPGEKQSGSSAMPQKVQVISIENARGTAQLLQGTLRKFRDTININRQQRELSDSIKIREQFGDIIPKLLRIMKYVERDLKKLQPNKELETEGLKQNPHEYKGSLDDRIFDKLELLIENGLKNLRVNTEKLTEKRNYQEAYRIIKSLSKLAEKYESLPMLGKTHNQSASPTTFGKEMNVFIKRLEYMIKQKVNHSQIRAVFENIEGDLRLYKARGLLDSPENIVEKKLQKLKVNEKRFATELRNHYECLGEAIQTILRKHQVPNAYEIVKKFARGTQMNEDQYREMIEGILNHPEVKNRLDEESRSFLMNLNPDEFTGMAKELAHL